MGNQLGVSPGSEMKEAVKSAQEIGAGIALIDRDIQVTFKRFLAKLSFGEKLKMAYTILKGMLFGDGEEVEFDIMYGAGISHEGDLLDLAIISKVVDKAGDWLSYKDAKNGQGRENAKQFVKDNK